VVSHEPVAGATEVAGYGRAGSGAESGTLWTARE
jgi:hypothetical protein